MRKYKILASASVVALIFLLIGIKQVLMLILGYYIAFFCLIIGITILLNKLFNKFRLLGRHSIILSFALAYTIMSIHAYWLQYSQPQSEFFGIPWSLPAELLAVPIGTILEMIFRPLLTNYVFKSSFMVITGILQWSFILFFYMRWKLNRARQDNK